jgi:hypothetical protein
MHKQRWQIYVHLIEGRSLEAKQGQMTNPLARLTIGPTANIRKDTMWNETTVNAAWEEKFVFDSVELSESEFKNEKLQVEVLDRNFYTRNTFIGSFEISLSMIYRRPSHQVYKQWFTLVKPDNPSTPQGWVRASFYVLGVHDIIPEPPPRAVDESEKDFAAPAEGKVDFYVLNILIYRAADLLRRQGVRVNPYVVVRFNGNTMQTEVLIDNHEPRWNRRIELPYRGTVQSEAIEVQVWNYRRGLPDQLIASNQSNFFEKGLTHKSWGPEWVNLYSSTYRGGSSVLGDFKDALTESTVPQESEYVGRVLMRMSVSARSSSDGGEAHCRRAIVSCNPVMEPDGVMVTLQFLLHSVAEIPVLGGQVAIEVVFGLSIWMSKYVLGRDGRFEFHEKSEPLEGFVPMQVGQIYHAIVNVYHKVGSIVRKIAFLRVPVEKNLFPTNGEWDHSYYVNQRQHSTRMSVTGWPTQWRSLRHAYPDPKTAHVSAGLINCSIGFGSSSEFKKIVQYIPTPIKPRKSTWHLTINLYQAANLLSGRDTGLSDAIVVVRIMDQHCIFDMKERCNNPYWFQQKKNLCQAG